jgi:hypothetical protein
MVSAEIVKVFRRVMHLFGIYYLFGIGPIRCRDAVFIACEVLQDD